MKVLGGKKSILLFLHEQLEQALTEFRLAYIYACLARMTQFHMYHLTERGGMNGLFVTQVPKFM